jgi:hypothetical protein
MSNLRRGLTAIAATSVLVAGMAGFGLAAAADPADQSPDNGVTRGTVATHAHVFETNPNPGRENGVAQGSCTGCLNSGSNIVYHSGGPVMSGGVTVYPIFYGNWSGTATNTATFTSSAENKANVLKFLAQLQGSSTAATNHYNINSDYYSITGSGPKATKNFVSKSITIGKSIDVTATKTSLTDADIQAIVSAATAPGGAYGSANSKGIYMVLTSAGITASMGTSSFLNNFCGYHGYFGTGPTKYAFVGDPSASLTSCAAQTLNSPHSTLGHNLTASDAMVSVIMHEIEEAVTDPQLNAWFDQLGYENGDKCAWVFGPTSTVSTGFSSTAANYNYTDPSTIDIWYIQQNVKLVNSTSQACATTR